MILLSGILLSGGVVLIVAGLVPATPHLADTIARLSRPWTITGERWGAAAEPIAQTRSERFGSWVYRRSPIPLTPGQHRALRIRGRSVSEFYADKAVWALIGLTVPPILAGLWALLGGTIAAPVPVLVGLAGAGAGFFVPDLMLRGEARTTRGDAASALLMYIDLVTLERLSNASSTQALQNAAALSDVPLFRQLRAALERARLEQQPPFIELRRLADDLDLPELRDLADVMQTDESGVALSGVLRARVRELRDANLTIALREANSASEGMTVYMTIPSIIFALIFLIPALIRLVTS
ncbi:hypothetical protein FOE78_01205 [Microlunatus elymi]|uniref:Type II secretion system (T2SS), protein F n=1 Tax=Microlunatus elymi TaxID=2596828 RepID=A0A516PU36_9ACTN|nr:hypothetical protein [Microlunatus elymi]QDP94715.1 hypothetical protein FOE78_01205 [Microlunatus elymi]